MIPIIETYYLKSTSAQVFEFFVIFDVYGIQKNIRAICAIRGQIKNKKTMNKKDFLETVVKVIVAALTAFLTAITTTSCMGHGPF